MKNLVIDIAEEKNEQELRNILIENGQKPTISINSNSLFLRAKLNEITIGLIGAEISGKYALIRSLAVLQEHRKKGVSRYLVSRLFSELEFKGITHLYLFSRDTGSYWQKLNFTECDVEEVISNMPDAPQVMAYVKDNSIWTDVAWCRSLK